MVLGNVAHAVRFHVVGGRGSGTGATARWGGCGCERQTLRLTPPFKLLHLGLAALPRLLPGHGGVGASRLQIGEAQPARKDEVIIGGQRWRRTGLGRSAILPPDESTRRHHSLGRRLGCGHVGAAVAAPHALGTVRETGSANSASAHGGATKETHAHAMVSVKTALAAVATVWFNTRLDVGAHPHVLGALPPVLGVSTAAIEADARRGAGGGGVGQALQCDERWGGDCSCQLS
jgi:hypothetical protein